MDIRKMKEQRRILIIYGYHPKETFATKVGKGLVGQFSALPVQVVEYTTKQDKNCTRNLRRFITTFGSPVLPIVLHDDKKTDVDAIIIYYAKSVREKKKIIKPLFSFVNEYNKIVISVISDVVLTTRAKNTLIDIEFNPKIGLLKAKSLVDDLARHLLNL